MVKRFAMLLKLCAVLLSSLDVNSQSYTVIMIMLIASKICWQFNIYPLGVYGLSARLYDVRKQITNELCSGKVALNASRAA